MDQSYLQRRERRNSPINWHRNRAIVIDAGVVAGWINTARLHRNRWSGEGEVGPQHCKSCERDKRADASHLEVEELSSSPGTSDRSWSNCLLMNSLSIPASSTALLYTCHHEAFPLWFFPPSSPSRGPQPEDWDYRELVRPGVPSMTIVRLFVQRNGRLERVVCWSCPRIPKPARHGVSSWETASSTLSR